MRAGGEVGLDGPQVPLLVGAVFDGQGFRRAISRLACARVRGGVNVVPVAAARPRR